MIPGADRCVQLLMPWGVIRWWYSKGETGKYPVTLLDLPLDSAGSIAPDSSLSFQSHYLLPQIALWLWCLETGAGPVAGPRLWNSPHHCRNNSISLTLYEAFEDTLFGVRLRTIATVDFFKNFYLLTLILTLIWPPFLSLLVSSTLLRWCSLSAAAMFCMSRCCSPQYIHVVHFLIL